jgi:hypothetical protein
MINADRQIGGLRVGYVSPLDRYRNGAIGWYCIIKNGADHFEGFTIPEADTRMEVDYEFILPIARRIYSPDGMFEINAHSAKDIAEGKMNSMGRYRGKVPVAFIGIHDDLALCTV